MRLRTQPSDAYPARAWSDTAWPVFAGAAAAVGVIGAYQASTAAGLLAVFVLLAVTTAGCLLCARLDDGPSTTTAIWWTFTVPLTAVAIFGLLHALGLYGLLVATGVAASSPPVTRRASRMLVRGAGRTWATGHASADRSQYARLERDLVNRRFDELVSGLDDSGEAQER